MWQAPRRFIIASIAPPPDRPCRQSPLDPARETRLVLKAQAGDEAARAELLDAFAPLVGWVAQQYRTTCCVGQPDLLQAGTAGILRALDRYDPEGGTAFWPYATWWVRQGMQTLFAGLAHPVASDCDPREDQ